ncbi:TUTLA protein, partial [Polypterus senegalus]|nr:TUTLA protein [Polypterus senegalus]
LGVDTLVRSRVGGSAVLGCDLTPAVAVNTTPQLFPLHVIEWVRLGFPVPILIKFGVYTPRVHPSYRGRVFLEGSASLRIEALRLEDEGWFECRILFLDREMDEFQNGTWTFLSIIGAPVIVLQPEDLTLNISQDAMLQCHAEAYPSNLTYLWWKHNENVFHMDSLKTRVKILVDGTLLIQRVAPDDTGNYTCMPTNGILTPPTASAFITVLHPAQVINMPEETYLPMGMKGEITCPVRANPPMMFVNWTKNGGWSVSEDGTIFIATSNEDTLGLYRCTPYNSYGTMGESGPTRVILQDPPTFRITPRAEYLQEVGRDLILSCAANGDPPANITWTKVGITPKSPFHVALNGSLILSPLAKDHQGLWECLARNRVASVSVQSAVYVLGTSPHVVSAVSVAPGVGSANISWEPGFDGGYTQRFSVWMKRASRGKHEWTSLPVPPPQNYLLLSNLLPDMAYQFCVLSQNKLGSGPFSEIVTVLTLPLPQTDPPQQESDMSSLGPPTSLSINQSSIGLVLRWMLPFFHLSSVKGFILESKRERGEWSVLEDFIAANQTEILVQGLLKNYNYELRMLTMGDDAISEPSESINISTVGLDMYPSRTTLSELLPEPLLAGVIGGTCFLLVAVVLSIVTACAMNRRRERRRRKRRDDLPLAFQKSLSPQAGSFADSPDSIMKFKLRPFLFGSASDYASLEKSGKTSQEPQKRQLLCNPLPKYTLFESHLGGMSSPTSPIEPISRGPDGRFIVQPECISPPEVKKNLIKDFPQLNGTSATEADFDNEQFEVISKKSSKDCSYDCSSVEQIKPGHVEKSINCLTTNEKDFFSFPVSKLENSFDSRESYSSWAKEQVRYSQHNGGLYTREEQNTERDWRKYAVTYEAEKQGKDIKRSCLNDTEINTKKHRSTKSDSLRYAYEDQYTTEGDLSQSTQGRIVDFENSLRRQTNKDFCKGYVPFSISREEAALQKDRLQYLPGAESQNVITKDIAMLDSNYCSPHPSKTLWFHQSSQLKKEKYSSEESGEKEKAAMFNHTSLTRGDAKLTRREMEEKAPEKNPVDRERRITNASILVSEMEKESDQKREKDSLNTYFKHAKERDSEKRKDRILSHQQSPEGTKEQDKQLEEAIWQPQSVLLRSKSRSSALNAQKHSFRRGCYFGNTSSPLSHTSSASYIQWDVSPVTSVTNLLPVERNPFVWNDCKGAKHGVKHAASECFLSPNNASSSLFSGDLKETKAVYPEKLGCTKRENDTGSREMDDKILRQSLQAAEEQIHTDEGEEASDGEADVHSLDSTVICRAEVFEGEEKEVTNRDEYLCNATAIAMNENGGRVNEGNNYSSAGGKSETSFQFNSSKTEKMGMDTVKVEKIANNTAEEKSTQNGARSKQPTSESKDNVQLESEVEMKSSDHCVTTALLSTSIEKEGVRARSRKSEKYEFNDSSAGLSSVTFFQDNDGEDEQSNLSICKSPVTLKTGMLNRKSPSPVNTSQQHSLSLLYTSSILEYLSLPGFIEMSVDEPMDQTEVTDTDVCAPESKDKNEASSGMKHSQESLETCKASHSCQKQQGFSNGTSGLASEVTLNLSDFHTSLAQKPDLTIDTPGFEIETKHTPDLGLGEHRAYKSSENDLSVSMDLVKKELQASQETLGSSLAGKPGNISRRIDLKSPPEPLKDRNVHVAPKPDNLFKHKPDLIKSLDCKRANFSYQRQPCPRPFLNQSQVLEGSASESHGSEQFLRKSHSLGAQWWKQCESTRPSTSQSCGYLLQHTRDYSRNALEKSGSSPKGKSSSETLQVNTWKHSALTLPRSTGPSQLMKNMSASRLMDVESSNTLSCERAKWMRPKQNASGETSGKTEFLRPPELKKGPLRAYLPRGYSWPSPYHCSIGFRTPVHETSKVDETERETDVLIKDLKDVKEARASIASQSSGRGSMGTSFSHSLPRGSLSLSPSLPGSPETTQCTDNETENESHKAMVVDSNVLENRTQKRRDTSVDESYEWDSTEFSVESDILEALKIYKGNSRREERVQERRKERPRSTIALRELESKGLLSPLASGSSSTYRVPVHSLSEARFNALRLEFQEYRKAQEAECKTASDQEATLL